MAIERVSIHNANTIHSAATIVHTPPAHLIAIQTSLTNEAAISNRSSNICIPKNSTAIQGLS